MEKLRNAAAALFLLLFTVSVFTGFPHDTGTRTVLGTLAVMTAGFLFGPAILKRKDGGE